MAGKSLNASGRAVAKNAASGYVTLVLGALLGFVLTPILLSRLGTDGFGTWSLVLGTVTYLALLELGLGVATTSRVAATEAEGPEATSRVASSALVLYWMVAAAGLLVTAGLSFVFPALFDIPGDLADEARVAVLLVGFWQTVGFIGSAFSASLLGTGRMYLMNLSGFAVAALVSLAQVAALLAGQGIVTVAALQALGGVGAFLVIRHQVHRAMPGVSIRPRLADRATAMTLLGHGWRNSITSVASTFAFGSDVVLVGLLLDPSAAATYAVALRGYTLLQRLTTGVMGAMGPTHAHAASYESDGRRFDLYCLSLSLSLFIASALALGVGAYAGPLLDLWLGDVPAQASVILTLLCVVLVLQAPGMNAYTLLMNSGRSGDLMRITVAAALTNVVLSVIFTIVFGTPGPAIGSLIAVVLFDAVYLPWRICKLLAQPPTVLAARVLLPLAPAATALAAVLAVGRVLVPDGALVVPVIAVALLLFAGVSWVTPGTRDFRGLLSRRSTEPAAT